MKNFNKSVLIPIFMFLAFVVKEIWGVEISDELLNHFADAVINLVLIVSTIWGIFKNHKKEDKKE